MSCESEKKLDGEGGRQATPTYHMTSLVDNLESKKRTDNGRGLEYQLEGFNMVLTPCVGVESPVSYDLNVCDSPSLEQTAENCPGIIPMYQRINDRHYIGGIRSQLKLRAWHYELGFASDTHQSEFLLDGVTHGFRIVDRGKSIPLYNCTNYKSCLEPKANEYLSKLFTQEIAEGKIVPISSIPHCTHAIGAIPKKDGTYWPITDCGRPLEFSINNFMESTALPFTYKSLDNVCDNLARGDFMCCTDIKAAYRTIPILPDHRKYQGFKWTLGGRPGYYLGTRLSFGLR